jgi:hypothetical protein
MNMAKNSSAHTTGSAMKTKLPAYQRGLKGKKGHESRQIKPAQVKGLGHF